MTKVKEATAVATKRNSIYTITCKGDYASSQWTFIGKGKECLDILRKEALEKRFNSRSTMPKKYQTVFEILTTDKLYHQSKLVNMASFKLKILDVDKYLELLNSHGVMKYSING